MKEISQQWLSLAWTTDNLLNLSRKTRGKQRKGVANMTKRSPPTERVYPFAGDPKRYLTRREAEVLNLICRGYTQAQVGASLRLSPRTVEFYIKNVRARWQVRTQRELCQLMLAL